MSRKIYSFTTGKLFESEGTYKIDFTEIDVNDRNAPGVFEVGESYYTKEDAHRAISQMIDSICKENGLDRDELDMSEYDSTLVVKCPDCGYEWTFTINCEGCEDAPETSDEIDGEGEGDEGDEGDVYESVSSKFGKRFAKYSAIFEEEDEDADKKSEDNGDDDGDGEGEGDGNDEEKDKDSEADSDNDEDVMKAVVLTVKHGDGEKLKAELLDSDYGFEDEDIDVIEGEESDDDDDVKVDASKALELKKYLADKKNIDLEEKIGGEIVDDSEDADSDKEGEDDGETDGGDDAEFDFDNIGDLFGAESEE